MSILDNKPLTLSDARYFNNYCKTHEKITKTMLAGFESENFDKYRGAGPVESPIMLLIIMVALVILMLIYIIYNYTKSSFEPACTYTNYF